MEELCKNGHALTPENIYTCSRGYTQCKECRRVNNKNHYRKNYSPVAHEVRWPKKTHCKFGHALTPENIYIRSNGTRRCLTCKNAANKSDPKSYARHKAYKQTRRLADPRWAKACDLKWRYGLSLEAYDDMLERQDGKCAICTKEMGIPHVDHDHSTHQVRELLCKSCNFALGFLLDDAVVAENLVAYIKKWKPNAVSSEYFAGVKPRGIYTRPT